MGALKKKKKKKKQKKKSCWKVVEEIIQIIYSKSEGGRKRVAFVEQQVKK